MSFLIDVLVVWRLTHMLQSEDGPYDIFFKFKRSLDPGFWFELVKCFYCLSVWFGLVMAVYRFNAKGIPGYEIMPYALALSGAAILLQLISGDK